MSSERLGAAGALFAAFLAGCTGSSGPAVPPGGLVASPSTAAGAPAGSAASDHGAKRALGTVTIAGHAFELVLLGEPTPGKETGLEVRPAGGKKAAEYADFGLYAWLEGADRKPLSAPDKGRLERDALHFHLMPRADGGKPVRVTLRLRKDPLDERGSLPLDGHGHEHDTTPHGGVVAPLKGADGAPAGYIELKLHDDKGDLELWLSKDAAGVEPLDVTLDAKPVVTFLDHGKKQVSLAVRNRDRNEDEEGRPNVRAGKTSYFIFPGDTGADASWLVGATFSSLVLVSVEAEGARFVSGELMLVPHTHADGTGH